MKSWCLLLGLLAALAVAGCGGEPRREIRAAVIENQHAKAERKINKLYHHQLDEYGKGEQVQNSRHLMLWRLERASADFIHGEEGNALAHLKDANRLARENRTRSAVRAVSAAVANDNLIRWTGEPFETVRIPYYGMLANLLLAQRRDGTWAPPHHPAAKGEVSSPPLADDAETLYDRAASGATQLHASLQTLADGGLGDTGYRSDPFLESIAAAVRFGTARSSDDVQAARIYARSAAEGFAKLGATPGYAEALLARINGDHKIPSGHGSVLVLEETGFVPKRDALTIYVVTAAPPRGTPCLDLGWGFIYTDDPNPGALEQLQALPLPGEVVRDITGGRFGVFGCEIPVMPRPKARPEVGSVAVDGGQPVTLEPADDVEKHARTCFNDRHARRVAAIIVRTVAKLIGVRQGIGVAKHEHAKKDRGEANAISDLLWFFGSALVTASEQADVRCWGLLPNRIGAAFLDVPAGPRELTVFQADGTPRRLGVVDLKPGQIAVVTLRSFPRTLDHVGGGQ